MRFCVPTGRRAIDADQRARARARVSPARTAQPRPRDGRARNRRMARTRPIARLSLAPRWIGPRRRALQARFPLHVAQARHRRSRLSYRLAPAAGLFNPRRRVFSSEETRYHRRARIFARHHDLRHRHRERRGQQESRLGRRRRPLGPIAFAIIRSNYGTSDGFGVRAGLAEVEAGGSGARRLSVPRVSRGGASRRPRRKRRRRRRSPPSAICDDGDLPPTVDVEFPGSGRSETGMTAQECLEACAYAAQLASTIPITTIEALAHHHESRASGAMTSASRATTCRASDLAGALRFCKPRSSARDASPRASKRDPLDAALSATVITVPV